MDPEAIQAADDRVEILRRQGGDYTDNFPVVPKEVTNWIDEQRAITETVSHADLSHHMNSLRVEGPEAADLLSRHTTTPTKTVDRPTTRSMATTVRSSSSM